jgi:outer membrane lipoprotein-sorting protein
MLEQKTLVSDFAITIVDDQSPVPNSQAMTYSGSMAMQGKQFKLSMFSIDAAYDGSTLYMYSEDTDELTMSTPSKEELVQTNPFLYAQALLPICQYAEKTLGEKMQITLTPNDAAAGVRRFVLLLQRETLLPTSVEIQEVDGKITTLRLANPQFTTTKPEFTIQKDGAFINDLR